MTAIVNIRQRYIAQNMSYKYCPRVIKFHCTSFCGLRAMVESSLDGVHSASSPRSDRVQKTIEFRLLIPLSHQKLNCLKGDVSS